MSEGKFVTSLPMVLVLEVDNLTLMESILSLEEKLLETKINLIQEKRKILRTEGLDCLKRIEAFIGQPLGNRNVRLVDRKTGLCEIE